MASNNRQTMGLAPSTSLANDAALKLYNYYRVEVKQKGPFDEMQLLEIEGDNLESEICGFCMWIANTRIPAYFDENLQPRSSNREGPVRLLMPSSLTKYVGKTVKLIRNKFPGHPDFDGLKENEVPKWWTTMRPLFETQVTRFHMCLGSDFTFGDTTVRPLYSDNGNGPVAEGPGAPEIEYVSKIDLYSILHKQMKDSNLHTHENGTLQQRCWIVILFNAVGRGGEIKFQDFSDWM